MGGVDIEYYFQWIHQFAKDALLGGRLPLWNPYNYGGLPFAANPQCSVFYPPSWLYLLMPVIHAHKWMIALHAYLAGVFMHLFLRRIGVSQTAAVVACLPWMFGSYFMANAAVGHITMIFTMTWLPLAMYCYDRSLQGGGRQWLFWTGFVLGIQILAGEPQNCYYTALLVSAYGLIRSLANASAAGKWWQPARHARWLAGLALVGGVALLASGVQFFLTAEYISHSDRMASTYEFATNRSFPPASLLGLLVPWCNNMDGLGILIRENLWPVDLGWEFAGYVGILTLVLAALSFNVKRNPPLSAARWLLLGAAILMLGKYTPIYRLLYAGLPGLALFRIPARAILIAIWALSVMSAFGLEWLFQPGARNWQARRWRAIWASLLAIVLGLQVVVFCFVGISKYVPVGRPSFISLPKGLELSDPAIVVPAALLVTNIVLVVVLGKLPRKAALVGVSALVAIDLWAAIPSFNLDTYVPERDPCLQSLSKLFGRSADRPFRLDASPVHMPANLALGARVENINGYWPFALGRFFRFVHRMRGYPCPTMDRHQFNESIYDPQEPFPLRVMNVRYCLRRNAKSKAIEVIEGPRCLPRAWLVERFETIADEQAEIDRLRQPEFDPATTVILERNPGMALSPAGELIGTCSARKLDGGGLDIATNTNRPALLVISEIFYPGWRARIDGQPVPLIRADDVITALSLPAGGHRITLRYEPLSFKLGCASTGTCLLAAVGLLMTGRRNRPKP